MNDTVELDFPPIDAAPAAAVATVPEQALDLEKMDLRAIALSAFGPAHAQAAAAVAALTDVQHDMKTQAAVDNAKSLRWRLVGQPAADVRKLTKGIKSKLTAVSKAVGEEEERVLLAFSAADALITPQIDKREAELEADRQERARAEAERKQRHEDNLNRIIGAPVRARVGNADSASIADGINAMRAYVVTDSWEEYKDRAEDARVRALGELEALHTEVRAREEQAAETERLRVLAEQQAAELEALRREKADRDARERAEAERVAAEKRAADEAAARAEREAEERQRQEAIALEAERVQTLLEGTPDPRAEDRGMPDATEAAPLPAFSVGIKVDPITPVPEENWTYARRASISPPQPTVAAEGATFKLGQIESRLGFGLTRQFVESLGFQPVGTVKAAVLFAEADWPRLCDALVAHIQAKR